MSWRNANINSSIPVFDSRYRKTRGHESPKCHRRASR